MSELLVIQLDQLLFLKQSPIQGLNFLIFLNNQIHCIIIIFSCLSHIWTIIVTVLFTHQKTGLGINIILELI